MNQVYNVQDFYEDSTKSNNLKQLKRFLKAYKLSQYFQVFVSEGFDRLLSVKKKDYCVYKKKKCF